VTGADVDSEAGDPADSFIPNVCCGVPMTFDPDARGQTCGGLALKGWNICSTCGAGQIAKGLCVLDEGDTDAWSLAKGSRSVACGAIKVRAEKGDQAAIEAVMTRIARLPEMEAEILMLRAQLGSVCPHRRAP
jgi:hypothetical protein